jgi:polyisoprenoid-binding protein YceI
VARYRVLPEGSQLDAEARSSLHPVRVKTTGLFGHLEAELEGGGARLVAPFRVEIDAERLRSGNGLIDGELQRRLDTRKFPRVVGAVTAVEPIAGGRCRIVGDLTLHGVTRRTDVEVTVKLLDGGALEIEGEKTIDMRDFGLTPPRLLILRVHPDVKVRARVRAEREAGPQGG